MLRATLLTLLLFAFLSTASAQTIESFSIVPSSTVGASGTDGYIRLTGPAPESGVMVSLSTDSSSALIPYAVAFPSGAQTEYFTIGTVNGTKVVTPTITATLQNYSQKATFTIVPAAVNKVTVYPQVLVGGTSAFIGVYLTGPVSAPTTVSVKSNSPSVSVPATLTIAAGQSSAGVAIATSPVSTTTAATITATWNGVSQSTTLTVLHTNKLSNVVFAENPAMAGTPLSAGVNLATSASLSGAVVKLSSSNPRVTVPATVTVPPLTNGIGFTIDTPVQGIETSVKITATYNGSTVSATLNLQPTVQFTLSPKIILGGKPSRGVITLGGPAPLGGLTFQISDTAYGTTIGCPTTVKIPAGAKSASFPITSTAVTSDAVAYFYVTGPNGTSLNDWLGIDATWEVAGVVIAPVSVTGGVTTEAAVTLNVAAPAGGTIVTLNSSSAVAKTAATIKIPAGQLTATTKVTTSYVKAYSPVNITATLGASSVTQWLAVGPTVPGITCVLLDPSGWPNSTALAISDGFQAGNVSSATKTYAALWKGAASTFTDLNPSEWQSSTLAGISGTTQVGTVSNPSENAITHAAAWSGTAASFIDLNPEFASSSTAYGVSGNWVVGQFTSTDGLTHGAVWKGSAANFVDLGYGAVANATNGTAVVGSLDVGVNNAALWPTGANSEVIDLYPSKVTATGWVVSAATALSASHQVGWTNPLVLDAYGGTTWYGPYASMWSGTAASLVNLHPAPFFSSIANGVSGDIVVGAVTTASPSLGDSRRAALWLGTAASFIDLQAAVGANWAYSVANAVYTTSIGVYVVGEAAGRAVLWHIPLDSLPAKPQIKP